MKKNFDYSMFVIIGLLVAVVVMSVGYAQFSQVLEMNGTATVSQSKWDIGFVPTSYKEGTGSVTVAEENRTLNGTTMTYSVSLLKPGEFYEFTVDVKNSGTFNANLTGLTMQALSTAQQKYLKYVITYDGQEYEVSQNDLSVALNSNATKTVKVRVEYIQPADSADLPQSAQTITLNASLSYTQVA